MSDTLTAAVCGGRLRRIAAIALFSLGAVTSAAVVGGLAGALGGGRISHLALAASAIAFALGVPTPQLRAQVPEPWRRTLPLPVWSTADGALLGCGFGTHVPFAIFWIALAAAFAHGSALAGALAFALFGTMRAITVLVPAERLLPRYRLVRRANAIAVVALAGLAVPAAAFGSTSDATPTQGALAFTVRAGGSIAVVVRPDVGPRVRVEGASQPSLDRRLLAVREPTGIRVIWWQTGDEVARVDGDARTPALRWPRLAYVRTGATGDELVLRDLRHGTLRVLLRAPHGQVIGRPALGGKRIAYVVSGQRRSTLVVRNLASGLRRVIESRLGELASPSLTPTRLVWIERRASRDWLKVSSLSGARVRRVRSGRFYSVSARGRIAYLTVWERRTGASHIVKARFS